MPLPGDAAPARARRDGHHRPARAAALWLLAAIAVVASGCSSDHTAGGASTTTSGPSGPASRAPGSAVAGSRPSASTVAGLLALGRPVVLAHAGGDDIHPHDTPFGFDRSAGLGVDALDMDVQLTADGVLVVQHDDTVDRTTDGTGKVASMTYEQLHALDAAYWFTRGCTCRDRPVEDYLYRGIRTGKRPAPKGSRPDDFAITSFEEVARTHPHHVLNIEIKGTAPAALPAAAELARLVGTLHIGDRVVVTSFDDAVVDAFAAAAPTATITPGLGATAAYVLNGELPPSGRRILQVPPSYEGTDVVTADFVARTHRDGLLLWVWPDDAEWETATGYRKLLDLGVDGLNAADPATAVDVLRGRS